MPRQGRPLAGQQQGGGKLDLGKLLLEIFGGVSANPDFNKTQDSGEFGPQPLKPGADNFYKPNSIFDKARASEANASFKQQQYADQQDIKNKLELEAGSNPILAQRERLIGGAKNANETALYDEMTHRIGNRTKVLGGINNQNTIDLQRQEGIASILEKLGQEASPENIATYNEMNTPALQETASQNILGNLAKTKGLRSQAEFGNEVATATQPDQLNEAKAKAFLDAGMAAGRVKSLPAMLRNEAAMGDVGPRLKASEALSNQLKTVREGEKVFNIDSRQPMFGVPSKTEQLSNLGSQPQPSNTPATPQQSGVKVIDDNHTMINGVLYRKATAPTF